MKRLPKPAVKLTATAVAGLVALTGCGFRGVDSIPLPGGPDLGSNAQTVKIEFANVLDLVPQSVVKLNDVSVGKVDKVDLAGGADKGWHAVVTVRIRKDVKLPDNAHATIGQTSLLGEKFVALTPPPQGEAASGQLGNGDLIPLANTTRSTEIEEVLSAMSLLLNGGGIEQVSTITHELRTAMDGREATIKSVLHRVDEFVGKLDQNRSAITRALDSIDRLSGKLADERKTIDDTITKTGPAVEVLNRNRADLTRMLVALDKLSRTTTGVIKQSRADLLANLEDLDETLHNLNKSGDAFPRNLEGMLTWPFPGTFGNVVRGDYGNVRLTIDLDFESLARNLLGGTDLEGLVGGKQMQSMLRVPNIQLPQSPLGVLPQMPNNNGTGGLPGLNDQGGRPGVKPKQDQKDGKPRALGGPRDLNSLLTGGLS